MEKKDIYLQNLLFLLFDEFENSPETAGEKVADAILRASEMLWPNSEKYRTMHSIRAGWTARFIAGFTKKLNGRIK